jgi:DNA uptake protein ComE-like DNA-binding protein
MLEGLPRMTPELAAAIVDWRDNDDSASAGGAESETYARLRPPYLCKNAPFDTVDELRLVAGATMEILLGEDTNLNGILDPDETDEDRDGVADPGILEYVTVWSREPNTRNDGAPRVNVNQRPELTALLQERFGAARAGQILARIGPPTAQFNSPLHFYVESGMTAEEFMQVEADITAAPGAMLAGRVNVNTAGEVVLACIPGIGGEKAAELVNHRLSSVDTANSVAWVTQVLSREQAREAGPFLTGQGYQFTGDVAACGPHGRGHGRTRFIFDVSEGAPKIIYRRNLGHLGWALGPDARQAWLATATP